MTTLILVDMTIPTRVALSTPDPLIAAIHLRHPINLDVIPKAIDYRESLIDQLAEEVEILKVARARLIAQAGFDPQIRQDLRGR